MALRISSSRPFSLPLRSCGRQHHPAARYRLVHQTRFFSVGPFLDTAVQGTQHLFTELHIVTGTPWFVTIPLIALSVNLLARLPVNVYTRLVQQKRAGLAPLIWAWNARHAKDVARDPRAPDEHLAEVTSRLRKTSSRLYRQWSVQRWKDYSNFAVLPVWLTGIEALRRLCGGPRGLLGRLMFGAPSQDGTSSVAAEEAAAASSNPADVVTAVDYIPADHAQVFDMTMSSTVGLDPTLATGGCLWFPDLTAPDPFHVLPLLLSAVLVINLWPKSRQATRALFGLRAASNNKQAGEDTSIVNQSKWTIRLHRAMLPLALLVGPATMDLPAALHLYWIASATITHFQTDIVYYFMKLPKPKMQMCRGSESVLSRPAQ